MNELNIDLFDYEESNNIIEKIIKGDWSEVLQKFCKVLDDKIIINYLYFKPFASKETYQILINFMSINIDLILQKYNYFIVHANIKNLTILELDKHKYFIQNMSGYLKDKYPQKLQKCYIYNAPIIFSQVYNFVSLFVDKETLSKIQLVLSK
jgi:hypothetical protein